MNRLGIIVKEVYRKNVFSWSFFWMIVSPILMMAVFMFIGYLISSTQTSSSVGDIAIVGADENIQTIINQTDSQNTINYSMSHEEARNALQEDQIEGFLLFEDSNSSGEILAPTYYRKTTSKDINLSAIELGLNQYQVGQVAQELGLTDEQLASIQDSNVSIESINVTVGDDGVVSEQSTEDPARFVRIGIAYAVSIIVFIFIMNYVSIISQEIAIEKGSRIMEIILSSVSPTTHFIGKLLGILLVIATQIVIYVVMALILILLINQFNLLDIFGELNIALWFEGTGSIVGLGIIYSLLGILIYTTLAGFLGSLVSKTEDVNKTITPIIFLALGGFYIGMFALNSTNNPLVRISSQIPLFTPFIMPFRIAAETVNSMELIISLVLCVVFMALTLWFSLVFYKSNVLVYSDKGMINTFKRSFELWKSERSST